MHGTAQLGSMEDLLESVTRSAQSKAAAENEAEVPTSGPDSPPTGTTEGNMSEGARSAENEAELKDQLGVTGAEGAPGPDAHKNTVDYTAAKVDTTGNDPESESSDNGAATEAEPGTSLSGTSISDKVSAWRKQAEEVIVDMFVQSKVAKDGDLFTTMPKTVKDKVAAANSSDDTKVAGEADGEQPNTDDPYLTMTGGDEHKAAAVREKVAAQLIEAHTTGETMADAVVTYLETMQKQASQQQQRQPNAHQQKIAAYARRKAAMGEEMLPPEAAGGMPPEMPPEAAGGMPPEAAGGMPPEGGGGMTEDPAVIMEALQELADEMGVPIEELIASLEAELGGGGGEEMPMGPAEGGMPPEAGGGEASPEPPAEAPPEGSPEEEKVAMQKLAVAKHHIKKRALEVIQEQVRRGSR